MTCRDIDNCENCPISRECCEVYKFCEERYDASELLAKIYTKGRADALREVEEAMYHECFEVTQPEDLQKWDSGNWFRYKLFENVMKKLKEGEQNEKKHN